MSTPAPTQRPLIWDLPTRLFHWLMVLSFAGAYLTAESERWRLLHVSLGYTLAGLVAFRVLWGLIGSRHARFASFVRGPAAVARYLRSLLQGRPEHHAGHNPAGALAVLALLGLGALLTASGWATYNELGGNLGGDWLEEAHEAIANAMLALVGLHIAAVIVSSRLHRENLVTAMITGRKQGAPEEAARSPWRSVAALLLAAVLGFWWWQFVQAQQQAPLQAAAARPGHHQQHEDGDDD